METKKVSIEMMHAFLKGNGAKFSKDTASQVIPQIRNYKLYGALVKGEGHEHENSK